ncbi:unnamed protein product [Lymnaea stagnalis]|uniref:DDB1- and CUL4-associated factor 17 n=1 Tax=Lymnaea stagnalis TaxID=6523 RepID=A0AAV2HCS9_LYMST
MPTLKIFKTSSYEKRSNIYYHLLAKEYCSKYSHRRIHHVLGTLITKGSYKFTKVWEKHSKKHIACDGRFAFFDNYEKCIDCANHHNKAVVKFNLPKKSCCKIEDAILMEGTPETVSLPHKGYRGCLLALNNKNLLIRIDIESGHILEEVYVGSTHLKFRKILWNVFDESFLLCSNKLLPSERQSSHSQPFMQLVVMSCMPLDFICKFPLTKQIFGKDACGASISLNILFVMHSSNHVRMYSLERIMSESLTHSHKLYDVLPGGEQYGVYPSCLTQNITLTAPPPCLFEVQCHNHDVMLTMPPIHYIMSPYGSRYQRGYYVFSFENRQMVKGGFLEPETDEIDDRVCLHADDSGRIIHMKNKELKILKLLKKNESDNETELVEDFIISCGKDAKISPFPTVTQSGRIIRPRVRDSSVEITERSVLAMMYSDELDMIIVTSTPNPNREIGDNPSCTLVGFYDNWNGTLCRQFEIEKNTIETLERSVCYNLDTLTHVFKTVDGLFKCNVFKLQAVPDAEDLPSGMRRR